MISKRYRLDEQTVRKVLRMRKPFFSYTFIANYIPNRLGYNRFAILLSGKQAQTSVSRNFFRRLMCDTVRPFLLSGSYDIVFVPKKGKVFEKHDRAMIEEFTQSILFSTKKITQEGNEKK